MLLSNPSFGTDFNSLKSFINFWNWRHFFRHKKQNARLSSSVPNLMWRNIFPRKRRKSAWNVLLGHLVISMCQHNPKFTLSFVFVGGYLLCSGNLSETNPSLQYQWNCPETPQNLAAPSTPANQQRHLREGHSCNTTDASSYWALRGIRVSEEFRIV